MRKSIFVLLMLLASATLLSQKQTGVDGHWLGTLVIPQATLRLAITLSGSGSGELKAVLTSIDQGGAEVPMDQAVLKNDTLSVSSAALGLNMKGAISATEGTWETMFKQGPVQTELMMKKVDKIPSAD